MDAVYEVVVIVAGIILVLLNARETKDLNKVKNFLSVLSHGSYESCPYFLDRRKKEGSLEEKGNPKKGGENL